MRGSVVLIIFSVLFGSCSAQKNNALNFVDATSDSIRVTGRVATAGDSVTIFWQGTSVLFRFRGSGVAAVLSDENGKNYFNIVIDGDSLRYIKLNKGRESYVLANGLADSDHTVELIKRTEWDKGKTTFYGLELHRAQLLTLPEEKKRIIEFFGNSITSGYANEDYDGDSPDSTLTNNYYSYAAITARHFNANYYCTSKSGIGIMLSWFDLTMPQLYNRLNPSDSASKWNFTKVQPGVVVINLFQNDAWLSKNTAHPSFKKTFGIQPPSSEFIVNAYKKFLNKIRTAYPHASIICALGPMDITREGSPWPDYVRQAVKETNDSKIYSCFFPYTATHAHPKVDEHKRMAGQLIKFIEKNIEW
jgi:hypothetical protein